MRRKTSGASRSGRNRGFVLVTMAVTAAATFGVVGLAIDVGRMLIVKNEVQIYCDSAAVAAALQLNGTPSGITRAAAAAAAIGNKWNFGTTAVPSPSVTFSLGSAGPWVANPSPPS